VPFFLGIDGGGTKTRCIIGDEKSELGKGSSTSCKVQRVGEDCARDSLSAAIHEACIQAGVSPRQISGTCAGITGSARPEIARVMNELIASVVGGEIEIVGDVEIAFEDAFPGGSGVLVIAGTGAIVYGRNSQGETVRAGGWGWLVSDEGSGHWVGVEAVGSALRERDRGENPPLLKDLMDAIGAVDFDDFIVRLNAAPAPDLSTLFPVVLASAESGNEMAREVLIRGGREVASMAEIVIARLFGEHECMVATHGGVVSSSSVVRASFAQELRSRFAKTKLLDREIDPARGALQRARKNFELASV